VTRQPPATAPGAAAYPAPFDAERVIPLTSVRDRFRAAVRRG